MEYQPHGLFNAKAILVEEQWYYVTHNWGRQGGHTFPKGIRLEGNIIVWLEFKITLRLQYCT